MNETNNTLPLCPTCGQQMTRKHSHPEIRWLCSTCDSYEIFWAEEWRQRTDWINANYDWETREWSPMFRTDE